MGLFEAFGRKASGAQASIYRQALSDIGTDELEAACGKAIATSRYFPTVAEIREIAGTLGPSVDGAAQAAFARLDRLCDRYANMPDDRELTVDDPILAESIRRLGGLQALSRVGKDDFANWTRKEFLKVFAQVAQDAASGDLQPKLPMQIARGKRDRVGNVKGGAELAATFAEEPKGIESKGIS